MGANSGTYFAGAPSQDFGEGDKGLTEIFKERYTDLIKEKDVQYYEDYIWIKTDPKADRNARRQAERYRNREYRLPRISGCRDYIVKSRPLDDDRGGPNTCNTMATECLWSIGYRISYWDRPNATYAEDRQWWHDMYREESRKRVQREYDRRPVRYPRDPIISPTIRFYEYWNSKIHHGTGTWPPVVPLFSFDVR